MKTSSSNLPQSAPLHRHHWLVIALHWMTALVIAVGIGCMAVREYIEENTVRIWLIELHRQIGMMVLLALVLRLAARFGVRNKAQKEPMPMLLALAARTNHLILYASLAVLPVLGIMLTNAHNTRVSLFGLVELPGIAMADADWANQLTDYHLLFFWVFLAAVAVHISSSLVHHFVFGDAVLHAMLPGKLRFDAGRRLHGALILWRRADRHPGRAHPANGKAI